MTALSMFLFEAPALEAPIQRALRRLPPLVGQPVRIQAARGLRDSHGAAHAGSFLRERRIVFDCAQAEVPRVFAHEMFHFAWLRLGNAARRSYEDLVMREWQGRAGGEMGWSAEWRKRELSAADVTARSRRWREYCCESFCDTAAGFYSGVASHPEFTLGARSRARRRRWFAETVEGHALSI